MIRLILKYAAFAIVATLCNLGIQRLVMAHFPDQIAFVSALIFGTGVGLVVKYLLDKKWIFSDPIQTREHETRKFTLYAITGIGTTMIFWGSETIFWLLWKTTAMREVGALIGLTIGYVVKFNLDKRYVFRSKVGERAPLRSDRQDSDGYR